MIRAVLFDCDGVLADSEGIANAIVAEELSALGWVMDADVARREFLGMCLPDMRVVIERRLGALAPGWDAVLGARIAEELGRRVAPMPGAEVALQGVTTLGLPMAVCSNSGRAELAMKMRVLGFADYFAARIYSFEDAARPKPAPDLYVMAARACGVDPTAALVIEDSAAGIAAGLAAGCQVVSLVAGLGVPHLTDLANLPAALRVGDART